MPSHQSSETSARSSVDVRRFPWMRPLALDYAFRFASVASFFAGDPASRDAWAGAIDRTQAHPRRREALVHVLRAQQLRREAPAAARASADRLADARSVAVVTGQQAGLFGGPLYTVLKAITAIRLAAQVEREHGVPAVPIFWVEAEDHDWDEVASAVVLDGKDRPVTVTLPKPADAGETSVARVTLTPDIDEAIAALTAALAPTEFTATLVEGLRHAYRPGVGMADAFARWIERLLGPSGLVVYDCADPAAKPLAAPVFVAELSHPGTTSRLAASAGAALESRGYHAQVATSPEGVALFQLEPRRAGIKRAGADFLVDDHTISAHALIDEAQRHPERFSPNVLLRPIVQDTIFPTLAYVAGPSELAYFGQLKEVYAHFGMPMPLLVPRATATLLDSASTRFLARYDVAFESLQPQGESTLNRLLEAQLPPTVEAALESASRAVQERMREVIAVVPAIDPTLAGAATSTLGRMEHDLQTLHNKIIQAAKRRDETLRRQFARAQSLAFPMGHPQERTLGAVHFLNHYGPALVDVLMSELSPDLGSHVLLTL